MNIILKETRASPPPNGAPGPFSLSDESLLRNYFINTGFKDVAIDRIPSILGHRMSTLSLCLKPRVSPSTAI